MLLRLPARRHPPIPAHRRGKGRRAAGLPDDARNREQGPPLLDAGQPRRLHGCASCVSVCPAKEKAIKMVPIEKSKSLPEQWAYGLTISDKEGAFEPVDRQGQSVPPAASRILGGLRRLRRDAIRKAHDAALRRPRLLGQRDRMLAGLGRRYARNPLHEEQGRKRPRVVELAL